MDNSCACYRNIQASWKSSPYAAGQGQITVTATSGYLQDKLSCFPPHQDMDVLDLEPLLAFQDLQRKSVHADGVILKVMQQEQNKHLRILLQNARKRYELVADTTNNIGHCGVHEQWIRDLERLIQLNNDWGQQKTVGGHNEEDRSNNNDYNTGTDDPLPPWRMIMDRIYTIQQSPHCASSLKKARQLLVPFLHHVNPTVLSYQDTPETIASNKRSVQQQALSDCSSSLTIINGAKRQKRSSID